MFDALYYPFSRCISISSLKQYLLLFDSLTFIDPVDDDGWRGQLYKDLEDQAGGFLAYRDLSSAMPWLRNEGIVKVRSPASLSATNDELTVAATFSDLADASWVNAANPNRFGIPTTYFGSVPSWHVFRPKIPRDVEDALLFNQEWKAHLLEPGDEDASWQLSYAAGSSLGINVHLAAAEELKLAPVTDSTLHHELMLRKLMRSQGPLTSISDFEGFSNTVVQRTVFAVISRLLPEQELDRLALQDILEFRKSTESLRHEFTADVKRAVSAEIEVGKVGETERVVARVTNSIIETARVYGAELAASRDKLWPKIIEGAIAPLPIATSTAALAASYITGSAYVLAASIALHAMASLKSALEWRADRNKAQNARSAVAYLSRVQQLRSR